MASDREEALVDLADLLCQAAIAKAIKGRDAELAEAREENTRLREQLDQAQELLRRIQGWDHMDDAEDGHYWRREIAAVAKPLWQMLAELGDSVPAAEWDRAAHARVASAEKELAAARAALERDEAKP